jgi:VIT1/CCC1 family predicted Fe2+/Mn2+ transporter
LSEVTLEKAAYGYAQDEYTEYVIYGKLSKGRFEKSQQFKKTLARLSEMEHRHSDFWRKYIPGTEIRVSKLRIYLMVLLRMMLGVTFAVKFLERNENRVVHEYESLADMIPAEDRKIFDQMVADEREHEQEFANQFNEPHIKYISFIVLGLADALVEIAGIHAGSLGIYNSTELAGLAGIVAGAAASIAMASAAYAQAKAGFKGSAAMSAVYTGISYFVTAVILATPYFLTKVMLNALFASLIMAVVVIAFVSFYGSVISGSPFKKDFAEVTAIMFGATAALYMIGLLIRQLTGISI